MVSSLCPCSIMLNILGEADGEEGVQRAHETMARAYQVCIQCIPDTSHPVSCAFNTN